MLLAEVGNDRPVRRDTSLSVMTGRSCSDLQYAEHRGRPPATFCTRAISSLKSARRRCAVSTARVAVLTTRAFHAGTAMLDVCPAITCHPGCRFSQTFVVRYARLLSSPSC